MARGIDQHRFLFLWIFAIVSLGLLTVLSVGLPATAANGSTCYIVSGAGMAEVNGTYLASGTSQGRAAYKHSERGFYISYQAHGWGNEWDLTTAIGGGADLYWASSSDETPPEGLWNTGNDGQNPRAVVAATDCSSQPEVFSFDLIGGEELDGSTGNVGAFTPSSCYYGTLFISKISPPFYDKASFQIYGNTLDVRIVDEDGKEIESYCGFYYVYFNLNAETLKLWQDGRIGVYQYGNKPWIALSPYLVDAGEYGRLAIIITTPGIYALASEK